MELVDGDDLSQRIARGAIPIGEALPIAKQITEALEAAHEQGSGFGGSWSIDGTIVFPRAGSAGAGPLWRVAATGGEPGVVAGLDPPRQTGRRAPHFLPDGRQLLFYAEGPPETEGIYLGSLDGRTPTRLTAADSAGVFLPPDRVVFVQAGTLVARRLDLVSRRLTGDPMPLADRIGVDSLAVGGFAVSAAGPIAYRAGGNAARQLTWFDRTGKAEGVAGEPDATMRNAELSPDGRRVVVQRTVLGNSDIWLQDLLRGGLTRLTFDATTDINPVWSPDGTRVAFSSVRTDVVDLYVKPSNGSGTEERLVKSSNSNVAQAWSPDGRWLMYYEVNPTTGRDLWALDMTDGRAPRVFANTPAEEVPAQFSPDGRLVAYQTNESGRFEVVVRPFPDGAGKWQVSTGGGVSPRWRADGRELYFLAPDTMLMAVPVSAAGPSFEAGTPVALFPDARRGRRHAGSEPSAVRGRARRPVLDQPASGRRHRRADHADSELAATGEQVVPVGGAGVRTTWSAVRHRSQGSDARAVHPRGSGACKAIERVSEVEETVLRGIGQHAQGAQHGSRHRVASRRPSRSSMSRASADISSARAIAACSPGPSARWPRLSWRASAVAHSARSAGWTARLEPSPVCARGRVPR